MGLGNRPINFNGVPYFQRNPSLKTEDLTPGWWFGTMEFYDFPFSWEFHHPSWRTPSFFRGVGWNHQPVSCRVCTTPNLRVYDQFTCQLGILCARVPKRCPQTWLEHPLFTSRISYLNSYFGDFPTSHIWGHRRILLFDIFPMISP